MFGEIDLLEQIIKDARRNERLRTIMMIYNFVKEQGAPSDLLVKILELATTKGEPDEKN